LSVRFRLLELIVKRFIFTVPEKPVRIIESLLLGGKIAEKAIYRSVF